jgi:hypothetical protein
MAKKGINTETSVPHNGFIVGGAKKSGKVNVKAAMEHDGIVIGGSVKSARKSVPASSINRLSSDRSDGLVI